MEPADEIPKKKKKKGKKKLQNETKQKKNKNQGKRGKQDAYLPIAYRSRRAMPEERIVERGHVRSKKMRFSDSASHSKTTTLNPMLA